MDFSRFLPWDQSELEVSNNILIKCLKLYSEVLSGKLIRYYDYYKGKGITEEALSFTNTYDTVNHVISDSIIREGKRYWEHKVLEEGEIVRIGVVRSSYPEPNSSWFYCSNGTIISNVGTFNAPTYTTNDIIGIALDVKSGILSFYKNGEHLGIYLTNLYGTDLFSCVELGSLSSVKINFQEIKYSLSEYENGLYDYVTNVEAGLEELQYFWDIYKTKVSQKYRNILDPDGLVKKIQDINNISSSTISGNPSEQAYFLNLPELLKSKGTLKSLKGIFKFFGIDIEVIPWYSPDYTKHIKTGVIIRIVLGGEYVSSSEIYLLIEQLVYLILDVCAVITNINVYKRLYTDAPELDDSLKSFLTTLSKCVPYKFPQSREDLLYEPYFVAPFSGYLTGRDVCKTEKNLPDYSGKYGNSCPSIDDCLNSKDRILYTFLRSINFVVGQNANIIDYEINDGSVGQAVTPNYTNNSLSSWFVTLPKKEKIEVIPIYTNDEIADYSISYIPFETIFILPLALNVWKIVSLYGNIVVSSINRTLTLVSSTIGPVLIIPILDVKNDSILKWKITNEQIGSIYLSPISNDRIAGINSTAPITILPTSSITWSVETPLGKVGIQKEETKLVIKETLADITPVYDDPIVNHWDLVVENTSFLVYPEVVNDVIVGLSSTEPITIIPISTTEWSIETPVGKVEVQTEETELSIKEIPVSLTPVYDNYIVDHWDLVIENTSFPIYGEIVNDELVELSSPIPITITPISTTEWSIETVSGQVNVKYENDRLSIDKTVVDITPLYDDPIVNHWDLVVEDSLLQIYGEIVNDELVELSSTVPIIPTLPNIWNIETVSGQVSIKYENNELVIREIPVSLTPVYDNYSVDHWDLVVENTSFPIYVDKSNNTINWDPGTEDQENTFIVLPYVEGIEPDWKITNVSLTPLQQTLVPIYDDSFTVKVGESKSSLPFGNPDNYPSFPYTKEYIDKFTVPIVVGSNEFNYSYNSSFGKGASGISGYTSFGDFFEYCIVKTTTIGRHNNEQIEYSENYNVLHTDEKSDEYTYPYSDDLVPIDVGYIIDETLEETFEYSNLLYLADNFETNNLDFETTQGLDFNSNDISLDFNTSLDIDCNIDEINSYFIINQEQDIDFNDENVSIDFNTSKVHDKINYSNIEVIDEIVWREELAFDVPAELVCFSDFFYKAYLRSLKVIYKNVINTQLVIGEFIIGGSKTLAQILGICDKPKIDYSIINLFFIDTKLNLDALQTQTIPLVGSIIAGEFKAGPYYEYDSNIDCATTIIPVITDYWGNIDPDDLYRIGHPLIGDFIINAEPRYAKDRVFRLILTDDSGDEINSYDFEINGTDMDFELHNMNIDFGAQ